MNSVLNDADTRFAICTITLLPEIDTYVDPASPTNSFAGQSLVVSSEKNKAQKVAYVRFDLGPVPPTANITSCQFYFTIEGEVRKQVVKLLLVDNDDWTETITFHTAPKPTATAIGTWESDQRVTTNAANPILVNEVQKRVGVGTTRKLSIQISSTFGVAGGDASNTYFSFEQASGKKQYAAAPRLVVQYKPELEPLARDWGQYQADAQHSGRTPWVFANTPTSSYISDTVLSGVQLSCPPIIHKELLYFFTPTELRVMDPERKVLTSIASGLTEFGTAALGPNRLLYAAAKSGELAAFDLDGEGKKIISMPLTNLSSTITVGPEGSVYLVQNSSLFAYVHWGGKLVPAWTKDLGTAQVSPVTLSADGSVAYIAAVDKLYAFYTADGSEKWLFPLPYHANHLGTPVAGSTVNVAYFAIDKTLYVFKDSKSPIILQEGSEPLSQPVLGLNDTLYILQGTKLYSVGPDASVQSSVAIPGFTAITPVEPVMDGAGNLFIIDNENKFFVYKPDLQPPAGFSPQPLPFSGNLGVLQVAPNGSIFCNSTSVVFRLTPNVGSSVEVPSYSSATSYRAANSLVLDGSALPAAASVVFQSRGTITIEAGFSLPKGTEAVFRTGS